MGYAAGWFTRRFYYRYCHGRFGLSARNGQETASRPLSVIVPAVEKDAEPLKQCLAAATQMIRHPLTAKWVVGPASARLQSIAQEAGWDFVLEDKILPRPAAELQCRGWVLQQFIKINAAFHVPTEDYLVLDADTVFLRPQTFFRRGRTVLRYSDQYELLYNRSLALIFGHDRRFPVSFVTHHMVFNRQIVREILNLIEERFGQPWWRAFLHKVDQGHGHLISFSEFELFGNYVMAQPRWRRKHVLEYWHGLDRYSEDLPQLETIWQRSNREANSISFHWHTQ